MIKQIYFLRHFKTLNNTNHLLNGRSLNMPIVNGIPIQYANTVDIIFCSTALRCRQTIHHFSPKPCSPIVYTDLLLERDLGLMEGQPRDKMIEQYPNLFASTKLIVYATPPNGEDFNTFQQRINKFWKSIQKMGHENILICSHNQTLKMLYFTVKEKSIALDAWNNLSFPYGKIVRIK